jgi:glycine cleavage system H protein
MSTPTDRQYLASHEWHLFSGDLVTIGITPQAAEELTDITFVSLPKVGTKVVAGKSFGEIESVKATSDLYCGVEGVVAEINTELSDNPALVNQDAYGKGWMIKVKVGNPPKTAGLISAADYEKSAAH